MAKKGLIRASTSWKENGKNWGNYEFVWVICPIELLKSELQTRKRRAKSLRTSRRRPNDLRLDQYLSYTTYGARALKIEVQCNKETHTCRASERF